MQFTHVSEIAEKAYLCAEARDYSISNRYNLASQICGVLGRQVDKFSRHY